MEQTGLRSCRLDEVDSRSRVAWMGKQQSFGRRWLLRSSCTFGAVRTQIKEMRPES